MDTCWYCGTTEATAYEWEHQLPLSRGGDGEDLVRSCRRCNRLKGSSSVGEYRARLATILRHPVTFAGEAGPDGIHTCDMAAVESVLAAQTAVRLSGVLSEEIRDAHWFLRGKGVYLAIVDLVEAGVRHELEQLRQRYNAGEPFPPYRPSQQLSLLDPTVVTDSTNATEPTDVPDARSA